MDISGLEISILEEDFDFVSMSQPDYYDLGYGRIDLTIDGVAYYSQA